MKFIDIIMIPLLSTMSATHANKVLLLTTTLSSLFFFLRDAESFTTPSHCSRIPTVDSSSFYSSQGHINRWPSSHYGTSHPDEYGREVDTISSSSASASSWSVTDDWTLLSEANSEADSGVVMDVNYVRTVAREMEAAASDGDDNLQMISEEDAWIDDVVDEIHNAFTTLDDQPLYDTALEEPSKDSLREAFSNDMSHEIAMLVRCNEQPESLLITEGRALPPLTDQEKDDVSQLVDVVDGSFQPTKFLMDATANMFRQHAKPHPVDGVLCLDAVGIASWMTQALRSVEPMVTQFDKRVLKTLSDYALYGSGRLVEGDFQRLYLSTIVGDVSNLKTVSPARHLQLRKPFIDAVWRDIRAHGLFSPVEEERLVLAAEIQAKNAATSLGDAHQTPTDQRKMVDYTLMDECEIIDWDYKGLSESSARTKEKKGGKRLSVRDSSSHKMVEMAHDQKTPLRIRDGEFVFIDEETCIGCMQCVNVAPSAFVMLESGRARTFQQRTGPDVEQAVESCPVSCMHPVSFTELKEFEIARDEGDGRTDHRHLGHRRGHTPLYVAGIDSDNNHRTSWYHTLKEKCLISSNCPQNACYDCPKYSKPGQNPFFIAKHKMSEHIRANHFIENGDVDHFRKTAEL